MSAYQAQIQRLFHARNCVVVLDFPRSSDWPQIAQLLQGVAEDLDLPLPAVSVQGRDGVRLWFAFAEPLHGGQEAHFVARLHRRYLADLPPGCMKRVEGELVFPPVEDKASCGWTAFIDPALGGMFADDPWLAMAPNLQAQAEILAGVKAVSPAQWREALVKLGEDSVAEGAPPTDSATAAANLIGLGVAGPYTDPVSFLLAVMNDATAAPSMRIEAAKALLPWVPRPE